MNQFDDHRKTHGFVGSWTKEFCGQEGQCGSEPFAAQAGDIFENSIDGSVIAGELSGEFLFETAHLRGYASARVGECFAILLFVGI